ncbi:hypothetical protein K0M31_010572, partial [Melipona bicolor]
QSPVNTRPLCYSAPEGLPRVPKASRRPDSPGGTGTGTGTGMGIQKDRGRDRRSSVNGSASSTTAVDARLDVPNRKQMSVMPIALFRALFDQAKAKFLTRTIPSRYNLEQSGVSVPIMRRDPRTTVSREASCDIEHVALGHGNLVLKLQVTRIRNVSFNF